ncbi:MAG TPA: hypothetical protein P5205_22115 [Candidatus Paceibacterota bacterium]|nr:hypothetical protein [Verrucomicrobiota bacterium]HSA13056.1 hypothetical protein [Candidatus Paceibacterota bacterium]
MRNTRAKALPYPVLTPLSDDVIPNTFSLDCAQGDITCDTSRWSIRGKISHQSTDLNRLVDAGRAAYGIHVECPRTFFRAWFPHSTTDVHLELPASAVWSTVELSAFCIASKEIRSYCIEGQHQDYRSASFSIGVGDILAFAPTVEFDAFLDIDPVKKISSILDIRKSDLRKSGPVTIDFNSERIQLELSHDDYNSYIELRADPTLRGLLASNVIFPAILQSLNYLLRLGDDELEEAKAQQRWCRSLWAKLEKAGITHASTPEQIFLCAQEILKEPVRRGLGDILCQLNGGAA